MDLHMSYICTHLGTAAGAVCSLMSIRMDGSVKGNDFY